MAQQVKRYPFNIRRHGHDIEYRRNRAKNEMSDKEYEGTLTREEADRYDRLIEDLGDILLYYPDNKGIVFLTGKEYGLAKETVAWAEAMRR